MSVNGAVEAILKLNPHPSAYAKAYWNRSTKRWAFPIVKAPLTREIVELHVRGKRLLGAVGSDPEGYTTSVGLDLDKHTFTQQPEKPLRLFVKVANALDVPIVVHTSKSGKGFHIRTIFKEKVPVNYARALYICILLSCKLNSDAAVDKVWPPPDGLGVLAFPYNALMAKDFGGTLALDPFTLKAIERKQQVHAVLDGFELSRRDLEECLVGFGLQDPFNVEAISRNRAPSQTNYQSRPNSVGNKGLSIMVEKCAAVQRLMREATTVPYEFWFGMMTNFKPFVYGKDAFDEISKMDLHRYKDRSLVRSWEAIRGGPRLCENLEPGWTCPKRGTCHSKAPAALPHDLLRKARQVHQGSAAH